MISFSTINANAQVPDYVPKDDLVAWYSFNKTVNDLSGYDNTPINYGATFVNDRFGNTNAALDFNGFNAFMILNIPSFRFYETGEFSYSFWLNKQSQISDGVVLMSGSNEGGLFATAIQGQNVTQFRVNKQHSSGALASCAHTINIWDHYVAIYNAGFMSLYKNGIICTTAMYSLSGAITANVPFYFGRGLRESTNYYSGSLDDIGIWTRVLTQQEIMELFTAKDR